MPKPLEDGRTGRVSAGCVFWMEGTKSAFTTVPEDHFNCSVGSVTHGLKSLEEVMDNNDVKSLIASEWVTPEEASKLPFVKVRPTFIVYGPLGATETDPDVILIHVNPFQAMAIHDLFGSETVIVDKPQCHIIPISKEEQKVAISTGCMLSRVRTGMSPNEMTCTIPSSRLEETVEKIVRRREANATVASYASDDMKRFGN